MYIKNLLLIGLILLLNSCYSIKNNYIENNFFIGNEINLDGEWDFLDNQLKPDNYYLDNKIENWKKIQVPSNWYLQGFDFSGKAVYHKSFKINHKLKNKVIKLNFNSVDYIASVWLNGKYLGFHEGYFKDFSFDISNSLNYYGENNLIVIVDSPFEIPNQNWSLNKRLIKGIFNHHDTRPGGAWDNIRGQEKNTGGIIGDVTLKISEKISIDYLKSTPQIDFKNNKAQAIIELGISSNSNLSNCLISTFLKSYNFVPTDLSGSNLSKTFDIKKGFNKITYTIENNNPYLWWSWDQGKQNLYSLVIKVENNYLLDQKEEIIGFKEVKFDDKTQQFYLNNQPVFLRGTNYISSQWLSEMSDEKYMNDVLLMKEANINAIRVHAHIESKNFYKNCDKYGIMVWQDFPLQWGYSDDPQFHQEANKQLIEMSDLLYNNSSLIAYSIHNEPPWDASWMKYKYKENYNNQQNLELDNKLFESLSSYDKTHYIHKYSSTNEHPWYGWYSGSWKDYLKPAKYSLITEFGAQALPNINSLNKIFTEDELWPDNDKKWDKWAYHNFQKHESFDLAKIKQGKNIDEFIYNTQKYQSDLIKYAAESYRRQKYKPIGAIFQFMFVEDWASINWGIIDYWREKKSGFYSLKDSYQPILPSIEFNDLTFKKGDVFKANIWIINDLHKNFDDAKLKYFIKHNNKTLQESSLNIDIKPDSSFNTISISENNLLKGEYELATEILDSKNSLLGKNNFKFNVE